MNQKTREQWLIPVLISMGTGTILLVVSLYVTAWATGVSLHAPFTLGWVRAVLVYRVPVWIALVFGTSVTFTSLYLRDRSVKRLVSSNGPAGDFSELIPISKPNDHEPPPETYHAPVTPHSSISAATSGQLEFDSADLIKVRFTTFESADRRRVQLQLENYRLTAVHNVRVTIMSASGFDSRHQAYREPTVSGQTFDRPGAIRASGSGQPIPLIWKAPQWEGIVTGENNYVRQLIWPENDKSKTEQWKLSLRVVASEQTTNAHGHYIALRELPIVAVGKLPSAPIEVPGYPMKGDDGTCRSIVRYVTNGPEQLLAYTTTRKTLSGSRYLVIRVRPGRDPHTIETSDRNAANAQWKEWYMEWEKQGFGGASGTGLDGTPPFG
jgi:hypothetical protein